nr:phage baseplate assembly protein V [Xanthomonas oryzae]
MLDPQCQPLGRCGYGGVSPPRVGQEVVVDFLDGDPDRPIITGRVYNEDNMPRSAWKSAGSNLRRSRVVAITSSPCTIVPVENSSTCARSATW